jgi:hypothetical protein
MNPRNVTSVAFAATMALAGFLLFQVQPLLAKYLLPWFGGSASTWLMCLLFFQLALLAGYAHAYAVTLPFPVPRQVRLQLAILACSLLLLPITPADSWKPQDASNPTWRIVLLLAVSVGVPYVALATTTPLLSRWLARIEPALDPARFFAASNLGSFAGLLSYPFGFERLLSSVQQTRWWSWAYVLYVALFAVCGLIAMRRATGEEKADAPVSLAAAGASDAVWAWTALSALGSALLLATTNAITQWSAVVPFLWIVPLSLYLLTFVIAFGQRRIYSRPLFAAAFLLLAGTTFFPAPPEVTAEFLSQLALQGATLFAGCMVCHGELVKLQPDGARLPKFYLAVAAGGALGGALVTLAAPLAFSDYFEHPLVLFAIAAIAVVLVLRDAVGRNNEAYCADLSVSQGVAIRPTPIAPYAVRWVAPAAASLTGLYFLAGLGVGIWRDLVPERAIVERVRNFYGVVKVLREVDEDTKQSSLVMQQAGVDQGAQYQRADRRMEPACGFDKASALGLAVAHNARRRAGGPSATLRIGVVGLGAGMIAAHGREGDTMRYYELNPAVLGLVNRRFTFVKDGEAKTDILLGDGRLVLERQLQAGEPQGFDILVLNAFRGASPPMHLMTKEAFDIYLAHMAPDGILAVNFEFEMFEMAPLHRGMGNQLDLEVRWFDPKGGDGCEGAISWALYTKDKAFFATPPVRRAASPWRDRGGRPDIVWTDSDSNLMSIINWRDVTAGPAPRE